MNTVLDVFGKAGMRSIEAEWPDFFEELRLSVEEVFASGTKEGWNAESDKKGQEAAAASGRMLTSLLASCAKGEDHASTALRMMAAKKGIDLEDEG